MAGSYSVNVTTTDVYGGVSNITALFTVVADKEAVATSIISASKNVDCFRNNQTLVSFADQNGTITSASLFSGKFPTGTSFNTTNGTLKVSDTTLLKAGTYPFTIRTIDNTGGSTNNSFTMTINRDKEALYKVNSFGAKNKFKNNDIIATPTDSDGIIVSALKVSGTIPSGLALNTLNGNIYVLDNT